MKAEGTKPITDTNAQGGSVSLKEIMNRIEVLERRRSTREASSSDTESPPTTATNPPVEENTGPIRITARSRIAVGHTIGKDGGTDLAGGPWLPSTDINLQTNGLATVHACMILFDD